MTHKDKFFDDLLALCVKHKANLQIDHLDFQDGTVYEWVEANGQWAITSGALVADKVITTATADRFIINSNEKMKKPKSKKSRSK